MNINWNINPEQTNLRPCPFCGAVPTIYCDLTDWRGRAVYQKYANEYRPTSYILKANHRDGCYIRSMNGTNSEGKTTSCNWQSLVEKWNRRFTDEEPI